MCKGLTGPGNELMNELNFCDYIIRVSVSATVWIRVGVRVNAKVF